MLGLRWQLIQLIFYWYDDKNVKKKWMEELIPSYPNNYHCHLSRNYGFIKTHKLQTPKPMRVITKNCGTIYNKTSKFINYHLMQTWKKLKFTIKDSQTLMLKLNKINKTLSNILSFNKNRNTYINIKYLNLVSFDVKNMYPSITHEFGIKMLIKKWRKNQNILPKHPSIHCIADLADHILKNGASEFDDDKNIRDKGT